MRLTLLCALVATTLLGVAGQGSGFPSGPVKNLPLLPSNSSIVQYAGWIQIDSTYNSNTFYWLFEAQQADPTQAPLLIWMNGGPGASSLNGLFSENGPFNLSPDGSELLLTDINWNQKYSMLFIDNPIGTGFSWTDNAAGFRDNEADIGQDLLNFLYQFYELYPSYQNVPLYICGESYAGKYVPAFGYAVHQANLAYKTYMAAHPKAHPAKYHHAARFPHTFKSAAPHNVPNGMIIPLVGISIGDGMMDPLTQVPGYGDYLFGISAIDADQRDYMASVEQNIVDLINQGEYTQAFGLFDPLMMSDIFPYPSYFNNATGLTDYFNFEQPSYPANPWTNYVDRADVKAALNIDPNYPYSAENSTVEVHLLADWMASVRPWVSTLIDNYKVLIYNGQLDVILSGPQCQNFLNTLEWTNSSAWQNADRQIWKLDPSDAVPAGYVIQGGGLTYAQVRDAGHLLPQDQPARALDLITRFVEDIPYSN